MVVWSPHVELGFGVRVASRINTTWLWPDRDSFRPPRPSAVLDPSVSSTSRPDLEDQETRSGRRWVTSDQDRSTYVTGEVGTPAWTD